MTRLTQVLSNAINRLMRRRREHSILLTGPIFTLQREFSIPAPSQDDRFIFEVSVVDYWKGEGPRPNVMQAIERAEPTHRKRLEERLRHLSRRFAPDAFSEAEHYMNDELEREDIYEIGLLRCRSWVRVSPEEALSKHLQRQWTDNSDDEAKHERAKRHVEHLAELRELWRDFLKEMDGPHVAQAIQLAGSPRLVGDIAKEVSSEKRQIANILREITDKAVQDHEKLDLYEYVTSYESALWELMRHLDIPRTSSNGADQ